MAVFGPMSTINDSPAVVVPEGVHGNVVRSTNARLAKAHLISKIQDLYDSVPTSKRSQTCGQTDVCFVFLTASSIVLYTKISQVLVGKTKSVPRVVKI